MVSQTDLSSGRIKQKLKTRQELIKAAWELLRQGKQPTVEEVAAEADVSRATAYRYFPNRERLLIEAVLNREPLRPEDVLEDAKTGSAQDRVTCVQQHLFDHVTDNETLHRSLLRATQEEWMENKHRFVLRGDQRIELLESALESCRGRLDNQVFENLIGALAVMVGAESYIALRDVCQVTQSRGREIMSWAVRTLVQAAVDESDQ